MTDEEKQQALRVARAELQDAYDTLALNVGDRVAFAQLARDEDWYFEGLQLAYEVSGTLVRKAAAAFVEKGNALKRLEETP